jgi:hypothetical protein
MNIRSGQKLAWENKVALEFNTTAVPMEFCLLQGDPEAFGTHARVANLHPIPVRSRLAGSR